MDRKNGMLDNVDQLRIKQIDAYHTLALTTQAKMTFLPPHSQAYVELELELNANYNAYQHIISVYKIMSKV